MTISPERQSARMSKIINDRLNPVWHRMLYSCTHMVTVDVKGLDKLWDSYGLADVLSVCLTSLNTTTWQCYFSTSPHILQFSTFDKALCLQQQPVIFKMWNPHFAKMHAPANASRELGWSSMATDHGNQSALTTMTRCVRSSGWFVFGATQAWHGVSRLLHHLLNDATFSQSRDHGHTDS